MADEQVGAEVARAAVSRQVFEGLGWERFTPHAAAGVLGVIVLLGAPTREQIARLAGQSSDAAVGEAAPAWVGLEPWDACGPDRERVKVLRDLVAEVDGYARGLGVVEPRTVGDVLDYLVACRVVTGFVENRRARFRLNPRAPLPAEVLDLPAEVVTAEDELRWLALHRPVVRGLIDLFGAHGDDPVDVLHTSLGELAGALRVEVETVRAAVVILGEQPDFEVGPDPERLLPGDPVRIAVDWANFLDFRFDIAAGDVGAD